MAVTPQAKDDWISPPLETGLLSPQHLDITIVEEMQMVPQDGGGGGVQLKADEATDAGAFIDCAVIANRCSSEPEALVGWRVYVDAMGEGLVVGVKRRLGRSTQHIVSWAAKDIPRASKPVPRCLSVGGSLNGRSASAVVLRRKESHKRHCKGRAFEVLSREF